MPKRKKQRKTKEKFLEKTTEKVSVGQDKNSGENLVKEQIKKACKGLFYISETDAEIQPFFGRQAKAVSKEEILSQTGNSPSVPVEKRDFADFFGRLTEIQNWFGDEEKLTAKRFAGLKDLLESNFRDLTVFKIGKINLDIYVVGIDAEDNLLGIKMKAVET